MRSKTIWTNLCEINFGKDISVISKPVGIRIYRLVRPLKVPDVKETFFKNREKL